MTPEQMLREFHASKAVHGGLLPTAPTVEIPGWVRLLREELLAEEVAELSEAVAQGDIVKIADALGDIVFVAVGTAVTYGIPFDAVDPSDLSRPQRWNMHGIIRYAGIMGIEWIERHRHQMTVGDRENDKDQTQRNQHQGCQKFSHDHLSY